MEVPPTMMAIAARQRVKISRGFMAFNTPYNSFLIISMAAGP
jgi:hypothetical protein